LKKITVVFGLAICFAFLLYTSLDFKEISSYEKGNNFTVLSETEMQALVGGCGSGGVCVVQSPTDCGTCIALNYMICGRGIGFCLNNQYYIRCNCGSGTYVWIKGCY
jgi:hypothetical protein